LDQFFILEELGNTMNLDSIKISGALVNTYAMLHPDFNPDDSRGNIPLRITNPFPLYESTPLLPRPEIPEIYNTDKLDAWTSPEAMQSRKARSPYITLGEAKKMAEEYSRNGYYSLSSEDLTFNIPDGFLPAEDEIPGVSIDPLTLESTIFSKEIMRHNPMGKMWFHLSATDQDYISALAFLQDSGVSAKASTGMGKFKLRGAKFPFAPSFSGAGLYLLLSPFIPTQDDLDNIDFQRSSYVLSEFSGNDHLGKPLGIWRYFKTGSLLYLNGSVSGRWIWPKMSFKRTINFSGTFLRLN
jgi:CRISPR type III-A-associated RAMP protein Csm4